MLRYIRYVPQNLHEVEAIQCITAPKTTAGSFQDAKRIKMAEKAGTEKRQSAALIRLDKEGKTAKNHAKITS